MIIQDDRTPDQKKTHLWLVAGTDRVLSNWGNAENGPSYAAWACTSDTESTVLKWVESRSDMMRVRQVGSNYKPSGPGHCHIYVVNVGHSALG